MMSDTLFGFLLWWTVCCTVVVWYIAAVPVVRKVFEEEKDTGVRFGMWILSPGVLPVMAILFGGQALASWLFPEDEVA